jgi:hypothetical protein
MESPGKKFNILMEVKFFCAPSEIILRAAVAPKIKMSWPEFEDKNNILTQFKIPLPSAGRYHRRGKKIDKRSNDH